MKFTSTVVLALFGFATAAPAPKRSAATVESAISTISSDLTTLDTNIKAFTGSIIQGLTLLTNFESIESAISSATSTVTSTGTLASSDSATIYSALSSLTTKIATTLSDTTAKASVVSSAGYTSIVLSSIESLQTEADAFLVAIEGTIDSAYTSEVTALQTTVDSDFATTIAAY